MANFFQQLSAEERHAFSELMAMRDADGRLLRTADEVATDLLKAFVTQRGRLNPNVADRLGGQPAYGRGDVLLDLVRALTGPHPIPQAWIDARRHGSFDLFEPQFYRARDKDAERVTGTPGVYLQRMVASYRHGVNSFRISPASNAALYTEAAMLTAVVVCNDLQKSVCAKQALGPAWVVGLAVDPLPAKTKRQMDALAGDQEYLQALGKAIAETTAAHAGPGLEERTNGDVQHSLPPVADIDAFFAGHDERQLAESVDALVAAVEWRIEGGGQGSRPASLDAAVERLVQAVERKPADPAALAAQAAAATSYLDEAPELSEAKAAAHYERLRYLMPDLTSDLPAQERGAKLLRSANIYLYFHDYGSPRLFGDPKKDALFKSIVHRINDYATHTGPPPPGTPLEHLPFFEAAANALHTSCYRHWTARERWHEAGLLPFDVNCPNGVAGLICDFVNSGFEGVDIEEARKVFY